MTGFSHRLVHKEMGSEAQDQRCEKTQGFRKPANRPAGDQVESDRRYHGNAASHHAPFHDLATGKRCCRLRRIYGLIVFHAQLQIWDLRPLVTPSRDGRSSCLSVAFVIETQQQSVLSLVLEATMLMARIVQSFGPSVKVKTKEHLPKKEMVSLKASH
jgi:hypothetical protein